MTINISSVRVILKESYRELSRNNFQFLILFLDTNLLFQRNINSLEMTNGYILIDYFSVII